LDSVVEIADYALIKTKYSNVVFSENSQLNKFGDLSLGYMDYLSEVNIPQYVTNFSSTTVTESLNVFRFNVDERNLVYQSIEGVLIDQINHVLVLYPPNLDVTQYVVPKEVEIIGSWAFQSAIINELRFEEGSQIWKIESHAFYSNIKRIYIPNTVTTVLENAYYANDSMIQTMIYIEHVSKPDQWHDSWVGPAAFVVWNYQDEIYG
jgi:hypothetical protein